MTQRQPTEPECVLHDWRADLPGLHLSEMCVCCGALRAAGWGDEPEWPTDPEAIAAIFRDMRPIEAETPEQTRAWEMAEAWREPVTAKAYYSEPYDCGTGL